MFNLFLPPLHLHSVNDYEKYLLYTSMLCKVKPSLFIMFSQTLIAKSVERFAKLVRNAGKPDLGLTGRDWQMEDTEGVTGAAGSSEMTDVDWRVALICIMLMYEWSFIAVSCWLTSGLSFIKDTSEFSLCIIKLH